jgi:hypothetical protein
VFCVVGNMVGHGVDEKTSIGNMDE